MSDGGPDAAQLAACVDECVSGGECLPPAADDCGEGSFARVDGTCATYWPCPDGWSRAPDGYGCVAPEALRDDCPEGSFAVPGGACTEPWICPESWSRLDGGGCGPPPARDDCPEGSFAVPWGRCSTPWICPPSWVRTAQGPGCVPPEPDCPDGVASSPSGICLGFAVFTDCGEDNWGPHEWPEDTLYVDGAAPDGGDGSRERPFATLEAALLEVPRQGTVALAAGEYPVGDFRADITVGGRCAARTRLTGTLRATNPFLKLRDLAVQDVVVRSAAVFTRVLARPTRGVDLPSRLDATDLHVEGAATTVRGTLVCTRCRFDGGDGPGLGAIGGAVTLSHAVIVGTDDDLATLTVDGGSATLEDVRVAGERRGLFATRSASVEATGLDLAGDGTVVAADDASQLTFDHVRIGGPFRVAVDAAVGATIDVRHIVLSPDGDEMSWGFAPESGARIDAEWVEASDQEAVVQAFDPDSVVRVRTILARNCSALADAQTGSRVEVADAAHAGPAFTMLRALEEGSVVTGANLVSRMTGGGSGVVAAMSGRVVVTDVDWASAGRVADIADGGTLEATRAVFEGVLHLREAEMTVADIVVRLPTDLSNIASGGRLTLRRAVLTGETSGGGHPALALTDGSAAVLEDLVVRRVGGAAVAARGATLDLRRARLQAGHEMYELGGAPVLIGALVLVDAAATIDATRVERGEGPVLVASASELTLTRIHGVHQAGVAMLDASRAHIEDLRLEDMVSFGLQARAGRTTAERVVVHRVTGDRFHTGSGIGSSDLELRLFDVDVADADVVGVGLFGADTRLERIAVRGVGRTNQVAQADGINVVGSARVEATSLALLGNLRGGLAVDPGGLPSLPEAVVRDLSITGPARGDASPGAFGVSVARGAHLELEGARIQRAVGAAIGTNARASLDLRAIEIRGTRPSTVPFALSFGLVADTGSVVRATDFRVVDSFDAGIWVGSGARLTGARVEVRETRARSFPGDGLRVAGGHVDLDGLSLMDNDGAGLTVGPGRGRLRCGRIAGNLVGVHRGMANSVHLDEVTVVDNEFGPDVCEASCVDAPPPPVALD